jgi:ring-1,2-phenylacetyl-CoA epoxidase subunit PaaA
VSEQEARQQRPLEADDDPARTAEFVAAVQQGHVVELADWMPRAYRKMVIRFMEMHAHSEYMGALLEREWLPRAPTLDAKLALASKVQDEIGHGQLIYRLLADLGRSTEDAMRDLILGRSRFHWFFHHRAESWADAGMIAWLSDLAASFAQLDLTYCSYGPYRRAMLRICAEEQFHITHGARLIRNLAQGTAAQRRLAQDALDRWWPRLLAFNGPPTPREEDPNITRWCIKHITNEEMRQRFLARAVPEIRAMGLEIKDPRLALDASAGVWRYTEPDWDALQAYKLGLGPHTSQWLAFRAAQLERNSWVLETTRNARRQGGRDVESC